MSLRQTNLLFAFAALALIGSLLLSGCAPAVEAAQTPTGNSPTRTITVIGRGEVSSKPDVAYTTVGVEVVAPTVGDATDQAATRMTAILAALKKLGIAEKDIRTSNYSISFERQQTDGMMSTTEGATGSYRVSNMVQVTIRDLDQVGAVLDTAVQAGANNVWGLSYGLAETQALEEQARAAAVQNAQDRAASLAQLNGVKVGDVIAVSEVVGGDTGPVVAEMAVAKGFGNGTPVEPGELTFSTQIQVVYALK